MKDLVFLLGLGKNYNIEKVKEGIETKEKVKYIYVTKNTNKE